MLMVTLPAYSAIGDKIAVANQGRPIHFVFEKPSWRDVANPSMVCFWKIGQDSDNPSIWVAEVESRLPMFREIRAHA